MAEPRVKVGLEVHQQLATRKLFCNCESALVEQVTEEFQRRLRPTQSELGEVDRAALAQAERNLLFRYQTTPTSCLVEADEEPPHPPTREALDTALTIALMLGAEPVPEVHFMRKIVIDGSNTAGFQRTALIALNGAIEVQGNRIGISTVCLEEDAARPVGRTTGEVTYRLDRLGIPLVEIATAPDIASPEEARAVAQHIGSLLRATKRVLRGIGTIREDLNVSIPGGARTEIKGVQELRLISAYVAKEMERQGRLLQARDELKRRGVTAIPGDVHDASQALAGSQSNVLRGALDKGGRILGVKLPGFQGLLKTNLGPELAAHARAAGVGGILHSDELPGYGITSAEVAQVERLLGCGSGDGFALVADQETKGRRALARVVARARGGLEGVPEETRDPLPDGSTQYSRPLPGKARMYPETDVPPHRVTGEDLGALQAALPEPTELRLQRLATKYNLHRQQLEPILDEGQEDLFEELVALAQDPSLVARTLVNTLPELRAQGLPVEALREEDLRATMAEYGAGRFPREAVAAILGHLLGKGGTVAEALAAKGLDRAPRDEVRAVAREVVRERLDFVRDRREAAVGPLMGVAMERLRGRADGRAVNEALRKEVQRALAEAP